MFQTMTQIGNTYGVDAKTVGKVLYELNLRDANHPEQKGFPYEQTVTHGIAKAFTGRTGDRYYKYDIERIKEEFEKKIGVSSAEEKPAVSKTKPDTDPDTDIELKLQHMLSLLNDVLKTGEISQLYRMKADIADLYAMLPKR